MGQGYELNCIECGFGYSVYLGVGMLYSPGSVFGSDGCEPRLADIVKDEGVAEKALSLLKEGYEPDMDYNRELYVCPECRNLSDRFFFKLRKGGERYVPDYKCPECRILLRRAILKNVLDTFGIRIVYRNGRDPDWRCPKCGCRTLTSMFIICWD